MANYIVRRLFLLPVTLFFIVLVNFVIINLAPGDPVTLTEISPEGGATRSADRALAFGSDDRYLQFREFYGLTLPLLINNWPSLSLGEVKSTLGSLISRRKKPSSTTEMTVRDYDSLRVRFGDQARFIMPHLLEVLEDPHENLLTKSMAARFFVRGGTRQAILGPNTNDMEKAYNRKVGQDNNLLLSLFFTPTDSAAEINMKISKLRDWYDKNKDYYHFEPSTTEKIKIFFFETRFYQYMHRVLTLNFGTLRNDNNKLVIHEVTRRFKYSLTLSILPMFLTFFLCQFFGFIMALNQNRWPDFSLNVIFLILYAIPIFVAAPFLIEKIALNGHFPFTNTPIPISGFSSSDSVFNQESSAQRLVDIFQHIMLPLIAIMYGSLAAEARLSRTAILEVFRHNFVRTAEAKGVSKPVILVKHVGRNAAITIVTSLAGSLGIILGGSLIVETLFQINGFGKFFYDAVINRDYNVIMFSALAGSFLTLIGYLVADIAYTLLDPRLTLE